MTRRAILIGPMPGPVHGMAVVTQGFAEAARACGPVQVCDVAVRGRSGLAHHLTRIWLYALALWQVLITPRDRVSSVYVAVNSGHGCIYDICLAVACRLRGLPLFLHFHSYRYITRKTRLMTILARLTRARAQHIFLCADMAAAFQAIYGARRVCHVQNAAFLPPAPHALSVHRPQGVLRIGFLSNLCAQKGLYRFLDLVAALRRDGIAVEAHLAGPAGPADRAVIRRAVARSKGVLTYLGPLYGAQKSDFYAGLDVFVFPSLYPVEAQPTVIFEAQAAGARVAAIGIGCVAQQLSSGDLCVPPDQDCLDPIRSYLRGIVTGPDREGIAGQVRAGFAARRTLAIGHLSDVIAALHAGAPDPGLRPWPHPGRSALSPSPTTLRRPGRSGAPRPAYRVNAGFEKG